MQNALKISKSGVLCVCLLFASFAFAPLRAQAQNQQPAAKYVFSLKQAVDYALANETSVKNAQIDQSISKQQVNSVLSSGYPQINGQVDIQDYLQLPTQLLPGDFFGKPGTYVPIKFGTQYNATAGISASQLIFNGSFFVGVKAAKAVADLSVKQTKRAKIDVVANVTKAYYTALVGEKQLSLLDANIARLQKSLSELKALNENGFAEKLDVQRLEVTINTLTAQREKLVNFIALGYNLLKFQMGMPVGSQLTLTDSIDASKFKAPQVEVADYGKRIEYVLTQKGIELEGLNLRAIRAGYLPSLAAYGQLSTNAQRAEFSFFDTDKQWFATGLIGLRLTVPIFDGLQKHANVKISMYNLQKDENNLTNMKNLIDLDIKNAAADYENNYRLLETQKQNMDLAQEISRVSQIKYTQGVGSNLEVITAETALKQAQTDYFQALYDLAISEVNLQKAKGILY